MDKLSRGNFELFEKRARELGLTPSQLLKTHLTGNPSQELEPVNRGIRRERGWLAARYNLER